MMNSPTTRRDFLTAIATTGTAAALLAAKESSAGEGTGGDKGPAEVRNAVDWAAFLQKHDMVWSAVPMRWEDGAFIGDGQQGAMAWADTLGAEYLRFEINRSDVTDRKKRLPLGHLRLPFPIPQTAADPFVMRVDLCNAAISGKAWQAYAHATRRVLVWEYLVSQYPGEISWHPEPALDARKLYRKEPISDDEKHPAPTQSVEADGTNLCVQPLTGGAAWAVAWRIVDAPSPLGNLRRVFLTVGYSETSADAAKAEALRFVRGAHEENAEKFADAHKTWWHNFWPRSFVSLPDARMEGFYHIQLYKLASATGKNKPVLDLMGPWFRRTPWTAIWWNLNIQLTYWPVYAAGYFDLGEPLLDMLDTQSDNLAQNVENPDWAKDSAAIGRVSSYDCVSKAGSERGNLTWVLHNYFWHCRAQGDEARLKTRLFPLLKRAVSYFLHHAKEGTDGFLHLPEDVSPEYPTKAADTNYDLSLLRWGCRTLLALNARYDLRDEAAQNWQNTLLKLAPYPKNEETGFLIGANVPLAVSHRHFSHLLMVFPLQNTTPQTPEHRAVIEKSLDHWIGFKGALQGYSYTGASALSTILNRRDEAVSLLNTFLDKYVKSNTMYTEAGPVIETPLSAACALQFLLLRDERQGENGDPFDTVLHVFSGVPESWKAAAFHNLRAGNAFVVSAARKNGKTEWVRVVNGGKNEATCRIATRLLGPVEARGKPKIAVKTDAATGVSTFRLAKNEAVLLVRAGTPALFVPTIAPVASDAPGANFYGLKAAPTPG